MGPSAQRSPFQTACLKRIARLAARWIEGLQYLNWKVAAMLSSSVSKRTNGRSSPISIFLLFGGAPNVTLAVEETR